MNSNYRCTFARGLDIGYSFIFFLLLSEKKPLHNLRYNYFSLGTGFLFGVFMSCETASDGSVLSRWMMMKSSFSELFRSYDGVQLIGFFSSILCCSGDEIYFDMFSIDV